MVQPEFVRLLFKAFAEVIADRRIPGYKSIAKDRGFTSAMEWRKDDKPLMAMLLGLE